MSAPCALTLNVCALCHRVHRACRASESCVPCVLMLLAMRCAACSVLAFAVQNHYRWLTATTGAQGTCSLLGRRVDVSRRSCHPSCESKRARFYCVIFHLCPGDNRSLTWVLRQIRALSTLRTSPDKSWGPWRGRGGRPGHPMCSAWHFTAAAEAHIACTRLCGRK